MGLMMLAAARCCIDIIAEGPRRQAAVEALADLIAGSFDEER